MVTIFKLENLCHLNEENNLKNIGNFYNIIGNFKYN